MREYVMTKGAIQARSWRARNKERDRKNADRAYQKRRKEKPWYSSFANARSRCKRYYQCYKWGAYKDINFYLTEDDVKMLWFRDKADLMKNPSIDRIDNDKDYTIENCRFIELSDNVKRRKYIEMKGENCHLHKLKTEDVLYIRKSKERHTVLAKRYGVDPNTIARARKGVTWAWL